MIELYKSNSPWHKTRIVNNAYLDILSIRSVPAEKDDLLYTLQEQYTHRPYLLAHDLYEDHKLWWVFAQRNMDIIQDPVYDFVAGISIYLPKAKNVKSFIGVS